MPIQMINKIVHPTRGERWIRDQVGDVDLVLILTRFNSRSDELAMTEK